MAKPYPSIRLFKSDFVERLTHVHPITPLLVWAPVVVWGLWTSISQDLSPWAIGIVAAGGLLSWTLLEYCMHRFVFHFESRSPWIQRQVYLFHGIHHEDPQDPTRLVMPPAASILMGLIVYGLLYWTIGKTWTPAFFTGLVVGYLCYDYAHFAVHHFTPRTPLGRFIKQYHMYHHFVTPNARWGVSSPLWDIIFASYREPEAQAKTQ